MLNTVIGNFSTIIIDNQVLYFSEIKFDYNSFTLKKSDLKHV